MTSVDTYWSSLIDRELDYDPAAEEAAVAFEVGRMMPSIGSYMESYDRQQESWRNPWEENSYIWQNQRTALSKFQDDRLEEIKNPTGRFNELHGFHDPESALEKGHVILNQSGDWVRIRSNLEESVAYLFQNEQRQTILGQTPHGILRDIQNTELKLDREVARLLPMSPETRALMDKWRGIGWAPYEAFLDVAWRSWSSEERKVLFRKDNPILNHIRRSDPLWTEEAREDAWDILNNSDIYGPLLEKLGMNKGDVLRTRNRDELFFNINNRRNAMVSQASIKSWDGHKNLTTAFIWSKRFIVDNFINDPDTAVEVGAADRKSVV
jgi:hypothetical protein